MIIDTFLLFVASLLFAGVNLFVNTKIYSSKLFKKFTFYLGWLGIVGALYLLVISFLG